MRSRAPRFEGGESSSSSTRAKLYNDSNVKGIVIQRNPGAVESRGETSKAPGLSSREPPWVSIGEDENVYKEAPRLLNSERSDERDKR